MAAITPPAGVAVSTSSLPAIPKRWVLATRQYATLFALMVPIVAIAITALFAFSMFVVPHIISHPIITEWGAQIATDGTVMPTVRPIQADIIAHLLFVLAALLILRDWVENTYHRLKRKIVRPVI